jgi:predicted RNA polymerase sigma factor
MAGDEQFRSFCPVDRPKREFPAIAARVLPAKGGSIELNHAAALAMTDGPQRSLDLVEALAVRGDLELYHLLPAVRADLLRRLGRRAEAREAYRLALSLATAAPERRLLEQRLTETS